MTTNYTIGKYYRLSSEDVDLKQSGKVESNSISNQRNLVESFIGKIPELAGAPAFEYLDDGWSGKNFERPDVQRLLADVRIGKINCLVARNFHRVTDTVFIRYAKTLPVPERRNLSVILQEVTWN